MPIIPKNRKKSIKISTAFSGVGYTLTANAGEKRREKMGRKQSNDCLRPIDRWRYFIRWYSSRGRRFKRGIAT